MYTSSAPTLRSRNSCAAPARQRGTTCRASPDAVARGAKVQQQQQQRQGKQVASADGGSSRRQLLLGFSAASLAAALGASLPQASHAGAIGDSIKGVLLRARRQNGGAKLLAPFESAKIKLQQAADAVATATAAGGSGAAILSALQDVRASSLNCYLFEALEGDSTETRASLITQQLALADPCTFRLVVKNVVDFSSPEVQAQGKDLLDGVIRSYALLDEALLHAMQTGTSAEDLTDVRDHLQATITAVSTLESFVQETLMV